MSQFSSLYQEVPFQHYAQVSQRTANPPLYMSEPLQKLPIEQVCSFLDNLQQDDKILPPSRMQIYLAVSCN